MNLSNRVRLFFLELEEVWGAIPGYFKVFLYSVISSVFGLWVAGGLDWRAVVIILATNLGLYGVPRAVNSGVKKL